MGRILAKYITRFLHILGVIFDIKEFITILSVGLSSGGGISVVIAKTLLDSLPLWAIILIISFALPIPVIVLARIRGRKSETEQLNELPKLLKKMHERIHKLALGGAKKLRSKDKEFFKPFEADLVELYELTDYQKHELSKEGRAAKRAEKDVVKKLERLYGEDLKKLFAQAVALADKHGIGLHQLTRRDFQYNFLRQQLDYLRPLPNLELNEMVEVTLDYSMGFNTLLMLQQLFIEQICEKLSLEATLVNLAYAEFMEKQMDRLFVLIGKTIREMEKAEKEKHSG